MYSLNNVPFENFGIIAGTVEGSNIALSGQLNMPARIGKTHHDWTGQKGCEPYVLQEEIRHGGRSLKFGGYLVALDKESALSTWNNFVREVDSYNDLVPFETPWGSFSVYIKEKMEARYLQDGWIKFEIEFQEPVVMNDGILPAGNETQKSHIDGVALSQLGMFVSRVNKNLNRNDAKEAQFTAYANEGYQVTPAKPLEFEVELIAWSDDYAGLSANIKSLHRLLAEPGTRTINIDGTARAVFNTGGFQLTGMKIIQDLAVCKITLPLMMAYEGEPIDPVNLLDSEYEEIANNINELIRIY